MSVTCNLPPLGELFSDSWKRMLRTFRPLMYLYSFVLIIAGVVVLVIGGVILILVYPDLSSITGELTFSSLFSVLMKTNIFLPVSILLSLLIVFLVTLFSVQSIAQIRILGSEEGENLQIISTFKDSMSYIGPLVILSLLTTWFVMGMFFLFIIPAIIVNYLFMFSIYEVIVSGKRGSDAIRGSIRIIRLHFFQILGRILFFTLCFGVIAIIPGFFEKIWGEFGSVMVFILSFITNVVINLFSSSYQMTLYKQAVNSTDPDAPQSLKWYVGISAVGWVFLILLIVSGVILGSQLLS